MSPDVKAQDDGSPRFGFGRNWMAFLGDVDEERIGAAMGSLRQALGRADLNGLSFLDIGSGSGLFSLAARRLGAKVLSFDYDRDSVECARELRRRYFRDDPGWRIETGSVLDVEYLKTLGTHDIVYSWGVLHHTGAMWKALANAIVPLKTGGLLFISIYNDQGAQSRIWTGIKRCYNRWPRWAGWMLLAAVGFYFETRTLFKRLLLRQNPLPFARWREYKRDRGMSVWRDLVDWVGGYPFEVAKPEEIFDFYRSRGFSLLRLHTAAGGHGCNEFVFQYRD